MYNWSFVNSAVCISLEENNHSSTCLQIQCDNIGLQVEQVQVVRHPQGGKMGCYESHQAVMRNAIAKQIETLLVFEDDARLYTHRITPTIIDALRKFVTSGNHWDVIYLGYMPYAFAHIYDVQDMIGHCDRTWMSHAYLISKKCMQRIINIPYSDQHFDVILEKAVQPEHRYVMCPMLYYQDDRPGSISPTWLLSTIMSIRHATSFQEYISYNHAVITPVSAVLSTVIVIILILLLLWKRSSH
jgi:glycosyl transferase family 25